MSLQNQGVRKAVRLDDWPRRPGELERNDRFDRLARAGNGMSDRFNRARCGDASDKPIICISLAITLREEKMIGQ
jgi:hypothetical protein